VNFSGNNAVFAAASSIWRKGSEFFSPRSYFDPAALGGAARIWQDIQCIYSKPQLVFDLAFLAVSKAEQTIKHDRSSGLSLWDKPIFAR